MPGQISWIRRISQIGTWLSLRFGAVEVGTDSFGNRYFRARRTKAGRIEKRFVFYAGAPEASSVPSKWFLWLHHTSSAPLPDDSPVHQKWEKEHRMNPTGTEAAWLPPGHALRQGERKAGPVRAWAPLSP
jgi:NADH:ubiquinone oxidoreductase subunit